MRQVTLLGDGAGAGASFSQLRDLRQGTVGLYESLLLFLQLVFQIMSWGRGWWDFFWKTILKQGGISAMPWLFSRTIFFEVIIPLRKDWTALKQLFGFDQKGIKS